MARKLVIGLFLTVLLLENHLAFPNDVILPFGNFTWQDGLGEAIVKANEIDGIESITLYLALDKIDVKGISNKTELEQKISSVSNNMHCMPPEALNYGQPFVEFQDKEGEKNVFPHIRRVSLKFSPIIIKDIPFTMEIYFASSLGVMVESPEKALILKCKECGDYFFPFIISEVSLEFVTELQTEKYSPVLEKNYIELKKIIKEKYKKFNEVSGYDDGEDGFKLEVMDSEGRTFRTIVGFSTYRQSCRMNYYSNGVYIQKLEESYKKYLLDLEKEKHKDKKDMSSDL